MNEERKSKVHNYSNQRLTKLPEQLPNSLTYLYCHNNRLTKLVNEENGEYLPKYLTSLYCFGNRLTTLSKHLPNSLETLSCSNNRLTRLVNDERRDRGEQLPNSLTYLSCFNNRLTCLPHRLPNSLKTLYCHHNPFLFNWKNNLKWKNKNNTSFTNYKILSKLKRRNKNTLHHYMNRDLSKVCCMY